MNFNTEPPLDNLYQLANLSLHQKGFSVVEVNTEDEVLSFFSLLFSSSSPLPISPLLLNPL